MPNSPVTIAVGTAWIGVFLSLWLGVQALAQVHGPASLKPESACGFPIEVVQDGISRLECRGESMKPACSGLEPGDRIAFSEQNCVVHKGAMQASMRLATSIKLDLNRIEAKDLALLKGIGPSLSRAIVDYREKSGPFATVDDLVKVRGIGKKRISGLRKYLTCAKP